jgi:hypothetical protein
MLCLQRATISTQAVVLAIEPSGYCKAKFPQEPKVLSKNAPKATAKPAEPARSSRVIKNIDMGSF